MPPSSHAVTQCGQAVGEPPLVLSVSVFTALRAAIRAAREERNINDFFEMPVPCTPDKIQQLCNAKPTVSDLWCHGHIAVRALEWCSGATV